MTLNAVDFIGLLMPPVIQILNKDIPGEKEKERFLATIAICLTAAAILKWNELMVGSIDQLLASFTLIFVEAQVVYKLYFKTSAVKGFIDERLTPDEQPVG
jgi:hypothetical protein